MPWRFRFRRLYQQGDINNNGLIDAADVSEVATRRRWRALRIMQRWLADRSHARKVLYNTGEDVKITVSSKGLKAVNALSVDSSLFRAMVQFVSIEPLR